MNIFSCRQETDQNLSPAGGRLSGNLPRKEAVCISGGTLLFKGVSMQLPYFKFMVQDWIAGSIQLCSFEAKGAFSDLIALIWKYEGRLELDKAMLCRLLRTDEDSWNRIMSELIKFDIIQVNQDGSMTVHFISEQMEELAKAHERRSLAGRQGGRGHKKAMLNNAESNALQSESDTESDNKKETDKSASNDDETYWQEITKLYSWVDVGKERSKMQAWLLTPKGKGRKLTRRFVCNWLNKCDKPMEIQSTPRKSLI